jgi:hypothetical protein
VTIKKSLTIYKQAKKLELRPPELRKNLLALLEKVRRDEGVRKAFVTNPTRVITSQVAHVSISAKQVSESNRLLYALIANDQMRSFLSKFQATASGSRAAKQQFAVAFAKQIASLKDENILVALVGNALVGNGIPGLSEIAIQCVCNEVPSKTSVATLSIPRQFVRCLRHLWPAPRSW